MPFVRVSMLPGRTREQKAELARAITEAVVKIAKAPADATAVVFEDISPESWAEAGVLISDKS